MCEKLHCLPHELRRVSSTDYINLIASMSRNAVKPIPWEEGGKGIVMGWVQAMKKKHEGKQ